jgi:two-component system, chemotaxis family, CheB/CheR fusion protein
MKVAEVGGRGAGRSEFPIVGIGASAGGLEAFRSFLEHMPADSGMAFVLILHLPADRKSLLSSILARWTPMRVIEAEDRTRIEPNHIYIPPPHAIVTISEGRLNLQLPPDPNDRIYRPIDCFFDSLGVSLHEGCAGVVLSGTGSDGALGLKAIKECGGLTIAQGRNGSAPQYGEMPAGAIATGVVDLVVPVEEIPERLLRLLPRPAAPADAVPPPDIVEAARLEICRILRSQLGHDFSGYRAQTFLRRVERRMQVTNTSSLHEYIERLSSDHDEVVALFRDLLIRVTSFFRDKEAFDVLESKIIPQLFDGKNAESTVRVWVPGCATGEEAYSLAILLREHMSALRIAPKVQLFATDIDESAIGTARLGRYPSTLLEGLSAERRARFFAVSQRTYVVAKEIRDLCTFSTHNVVRDPPFSRMDLVSCRNLLIYMNPELQARIIPVFHYALAPGGLLLLGGSESVAQHVDLFETVDKPARIFRRRDVRSPDLSLSLRDPDFRSRNLHAAGASSTQGEEVRNQVPGDARPSSTIEQARSAGFERAPPWPYERLLGALEPSVEIIGQLQGALASTRERLQSLEEEHQTAREELRSSNEELHSVNEELQSSNEELETSKEELQSLNEELHTVNLRLTEKVDALDSANSDLRNLFDSTQIATVFLDRHLIIRSFTPAVATLYNLIPSDQGRPLTDIVSRLAYEHLRRDVSQVLLTLEPLERRVVRNDHAVHYIMRILPYREPDSLVSGVLITFVDVTSIVQAEAALVEADIRKDVFLATLSHELRNPLAPIRTAARLLQTKGLSDEQLSSAQAIIARQVRHMSSLLDDLLDVSRITRGAFTLKRSQVPIDELIGSAVEAAQSTIDAKQHTLRVESDLSQRTLDVDAVRMTQVLSNLLVNAAKYTPVGGLITLECRLESHGVVFSVCDNGVGISADMLGKVFDLFTRIDSTTGSADGGLGIGLALAKGLVELHGGHIEARSLGIGEGSAFIVSLPRAALLDFQMDQSTDGASAISVQSKRVLIADDNRDGAESMQLYLQMQGHEVHVAFNGTEALSIAAQIKPEVGVIDIGLPDISGHEVARRMREEVWGRGVLLIALTGWGQESDKLRARAAGFDRHCTKPVDPVELERLFFSS